jgi:hypothetical protein
MGNELVPQNLVEGELLNQDFDDITSSGIVYLQRLQLFGSKSDACAEGRIGIGHWGLVNDDVITDLGDEADIVLLAYRPKALDTGGEVIITDYDVQSETFNRIREESFVKDSGCMYGPEFLVYVPSQDAFATYFASSKTARREAKKFRPLLGQAATVKSRLIEKGKYKWHGPVILPCSTPMTMPGMEIIKSQIEKFANPPKDEVEVAPEDGEGGRER